MIWRSPGATAAVSTKHLAVMDQMLQAKLLLSLFSHCPIECRCQTRQEEHDPAADPPQPVANSDAVPLFLAALRAAAPSERSRGLGLWAALLRGSMVNLSACER